MPAPEEYTTAWLSCLLAGQVLHCMERHAWRCFYILLCKMCTAGIASSGSCGACMWADAAQIWRRWLSVRLESLGAVAALAAAVLTVEQRGAASTFGLVLSYALSITMLTSMTVCFS